MMSLNIQWQSGRLARPYHEISRDEFDAEVYLSAFSLRDVRTEFAMDKSARVTYYIYDHAVFAVTCRWWHTPDKFPGVMVKKQDGVYLYLRYYRIGCTHPNMRIERQDMHSYTEYCPDCDFTRSFDSSG